MKSNLRSYFATCQLCLDFSDQIVRHDNSSVHVQGSCAPFERGQLQITPLDNQYASYHHPCYC